METNINRNRMKNFLTAILFLGVCIASFSQQLKPEQVKKEMKRVADWQIEHFRDTYSGRSEPHHPLFWTNGALYVGMVKWAKMAGDNSYWEWLRKIGEEHD